MQKSKLRAYAHLIARKGVNIQKRQSVIIEAELDQPEFIEILVDECYKAGASKVDVRWSHQALTKLNVRHQTLKNLTTVEDWELERMKHQEETLPARIVILSDDPDGLKGVNMDKYSKASQARRKAFKPYRDRMENKYQWCIAAVPGVKWAKKLFPNDRKSVAVEKLWQAILSASRADIDPIKQWEEHNANIAKRCEYLNSLGVSELRYKSANGTDFTVGLIEGAVFVGGAGGTTKGVMFNANIPSEEVFITPMKGKAEGKVVSTMPLSYESQLIENFSITFKDGKAVEYSAEKNEELLGKLLSMDENAGYLGECALVPFDSPINNSGILYYNTLFDENASCHLALGAGYSECIPGFENMTFEECVEKGCNDSIIHVDFMIGAPDLSVIGVDSNGKETPLFVDGNWAF
ncbi:MAG: aminopeptidase [Clostridia bacterium]|nr:aminopeptidase [Clostridia bacterium]